MTPAYPRGSSKSLLALEKESAMRLGQVRSGTSQPSSSSAASFVQGSYGHRYLHNLQLKACSSREPELLQSPFKSLLPSVRVLNICFSSEQQSQSSPLCFLSYPTPKKKKKELLGLTGRLSLINLYGPDGSSFIAHFTPPNIFTLLLLLAGLILLSIFPFWPKYLSKAFHTYKKISI